MSSSACPASSKSPLRALFALSLGLAALTGCDWSAIEPVGRVREAPVLPAGQDSSIVDLVVLHTNDIHGQTYPRRDRERPGGTIGGLSALAKLIRLERAAAEKAGKTVLVLDGGDLFQGTPEGNLSEGQIIVDFMNSVGYDAVVIGNHEYDFGQHIPRGIADGLEKPVFLGANVRYSASRRRVPYLSSHARFDLRGLPIQVIGLTTSHMKSVTLAGVTDGLDFVDEQLEMGRVLGELGIRGKGQAITILVSHIGHETDAALARAFPAIDLVIGGHSHRAIKEPAPAGPGLAMVCQAGAKTLYLGRVDLRVDLKRKRVVHAEGRLIPVRADVIGKDDEVEEVIARYAPKIGAIMDQVVGTAAADLTRESRPVSSPLGNFLADTMREAGEADVAFQNKGGIRSDIPKGPITRRSIYEVSPFGNTLVTLTMTGAQIRRLLERALASDHSFFEVSGMTCVHDSRRPAGRRIVAITIGGEPLDPKRRYKVATNNFLARGGDGARGFGEAQDRVNTFKLLRDLQRARLKKLGTLRPDHSLRLKDLAPAEDE